MTAGLTGAVVVVTGGASGIGRALAGRFAAEGARSVVVVDRDATGAESVAAGLSCPVPLGVGCDVTVRADVADLVARIEHEIGPIDLWCSNAGVAVGDGLGEDPDWELSWRVHVLAHLHAAKTVLPRMLARGRGHLMVTASAAGLLTEMDTAPYTVTKHGAVAFAEWLAIRYGESGVGFSCLCPQGVNTPMLAGAGPDSATVAAGDVIEPERVADAVVHALASGHFLILPQPRVADFERRRADDRDRWLAGMRRAWSRLVDARRVRARLASCPDDHPAGTIAGAVRDPEPA